MQFIQKQVGRWGGKAVGQEEEVLHDVKESECMIVWSSDVRILGVYSV